MRRGNDSLEAKNIRDMIEYICYKEHKSASKIVTEYNEKYQENYTPQSFSRSLIKNSLKFSMLERILDSAGYRLVLEKKKKIRWIWNSKHLFYAYIFYVAADF